MEHIRLFEELVDEGAKPAISIVRVDSSRGGRDRTNYVKGTLEDLKSYFGYTLEVGHSWKSSINKDPKTIKAFIKALQDSYSQKEAAIYNRTNVSLVDSIPDGVDKNDISDKTTASSASTVVAEGDSAKMKASMAIMSHLSDAQEIQYESNPGRRLSLTNQHINFAKFLILKYPNTATLIDADADFEEYEKKHKK